MRISLLPSITSNTFFPRLPAVGLLLFVICGILLGRNSPTGSFPLFSVGAIILALITVIAGIRAYSRNFSAPVASISLFASLLLIGAAIAAMPQQRPAQEWSSDCLYRFTGLVTAVSDSENYSTLTLRSVEVGGVQIEEATVFLDSQHREYIVPGCVVASTCRLTMDDGKVLLRPAGGLRVTVANSFGMVASLGAIRHYLSYELHKRLDPKSAGLVEAVTLGVRENLDGGWREAFLLSGNTHLLAVSGLHVAVVAGLALFLASIFGLSLHARLLCTVIVTLGYLTLVGFNPPAMRASLLCGSVFLAAVVGRPVAALNALAFVALILLLCEPSAVESVSFQLSFCAALGIVVLGLPLAAKLVIPPLASRLNKAFYRLGQGALVSLGAWAFATPLVWYHFGNVTPFSFLAALPAVPVLALLVPAGLGMLCLVILTGGAFVPVSPVEWIAHLLAFINKLISLVPATFFRAAAPDAIVVVLWLLILVSLAAALHFRRRLTAMALCLLLIPLALVGPRSVAGVFCMDNDAVAVSNGRTSVVLVMSGTPEWYLRASLHRMGIPQPSAFIPDPQRGSPQCSRSTIPTFGHYKNVVYAFDGIEITWSPPSAAYTGGAKTRAQSSVWTVFAPACGFQGSFRK